MQRLSVRNILAVLVVLCLGPFLPANAQEPPTIIDPSAASDVILSDKPQDVFAYPAPKQNGPPQNLSQYTGDYDHIDILHVSFTNETAASFKVTLYLRSLTNGAPYGNPVREIFFDYGQVHWRIGQGACGRFGNQGGGQACLQSFDAGREGFRTVKGLPIETLSAQKALAFTVNKQDVYNENHVPARFGDQLSDLRARATHTTGGFDPTGGFEPTGGVVVRDQVPDTGPGPLFVFHKGSQNHGSLSLWCPDPIRVSNGEATTIVYKVVVTNNRSRADTVALQAQQLPEDWSARVPALVNVPPNSNATVYVILTLPFTHFHGETHSFSLTAKSSDDRNAYASLELGVFWTDVPQPSAHHQGKLWFHSAPADNTNMPNEVEPLVPTMTGWINGAKEDLDPNAGEENLPASGGSGPGSGFGGGGGGNGPGNTRSNLTWFFPLAPALQIGLDFDTTKPATLHFGLLTKNPATDAKVIVRLHYCDPNRRVERQGQGPSGPAPCNSNAAVIGVYSQSVNVGANAEIPIDAVIPIDPKYDLVPYLRDANIGLSVLLSTDTPQNTMSVAQRAEFKIKDGLIQLPLIEYHDPIEKALANVGNLNLVLTSPREKLVNPGRTTVFYFELSSSDVSGRLPVRLEAQGTNVEWATVLGPTVFDLKPLETRNITLAIRVPSDAAPEDRAEMWLLAQSLRDVTVMTAVQMRATVVKEPLVPDEAGLAVARGEANGTPGFEAVGLLVLLVGLGALRRRRGR